MCAQRPERVPGFRPAIFPTVDTSWQGNPPQRMSTAGTAFQSMVVMSPRFGASGQWWEKTRATGSLISENQIVRALKTSSTARSSPPYPENSDPIRSGAAGLVRGWSATGEPPGTVIPGAVLLLRAGHHPGARAAPSTAIPSALPESCRLPSLAQPLTSRGSLARVVTPLASEEYRIIWGRRQRVSDPR